MHLLGQHFLDLLRHRLLRHLGHDAVTGRVALRASGAGIVDRVGHFLFHGLGEHLLQFLWHDAGAYGVGLVGSLRHVDRGWNVRVKMLFLVLGVVELGFLKCLEAVRLCGVCVLGEGGWGYGGGLYRFLVVA